MHLVDLAPLVATADTLDDLLEQTGGAWSDIYDAMMPEEILWVFAPNTYRDGVCWPVAMTVADYARDEASLTLKNIITRYQEPVEAGDLRASYEEILFFVKDKREYRFDKDAVRVEHVFEGKDWTNNRKSGTSAYHDTEVRRYNPNGKDPGNVWLDEIRDTTPGETVDETRPLQREEALRRCLRAGSREGEIVYTYWVDETFKQAVVAENRQPSEVVTRELVA